MSGVGSRIDDYGVPKEDLSKVDQVFDDTGRMTRIKPSGPRSQAELDAMLEVVSQVKKATVTQTKAFLQLAKCKKPLDAQEQIFVDNYLISRNAPDAAEKAGYSKSSCTKSAYNWVKPDYKKNKKPHIFSAIHSGLKKLEKLAIKQAADALTEDIIDAEYVKRKSVELINKSNGDLPTHTTVRKCKETGDIIETKHYAYNAQGVTKGIELVGKHKDVKAFDNTVELDVNSTLSSLLSNISTTTGPPALRGECTEVIDEITYKEKEEPIISEGNDFTPPAPPPPEALVQKPVAPKFVKNKKILRDLPPPPVPK